MRLEPLLVGQARTGEGPGLRRHHRADRRPDVLIRHILIFPVETMQAATEILLVNALQRNAEGIRDPFSGLVADLTLQNPGIREPSDSLLWRGVDIFAPTWNFTVKIAVALWPATLAIMVALAAQESAISTDWGIAGLKGALAQWLEDVLACAFSLEFMDLANRLSNAVIAGIVALPIRGALCLDVETIVNALLGAALRVFGMGVSPAAAIIAVLVELVLGLALVISIVGQYYACVALLYIVVALVPLVLVRSPLRPARWLQWMWIKGLLPVILVGAIIKGPFGAAVEVVGKALETATGVMRGAATAAAAIGAAALSRGVALGVLPGALAGAGGGGAAAAAGASARSRSAGTVAAALSAAGSTPRAAGRTGSRTAAAYTGMAAAQADPDPGAGPLATGGSAGGAVGTPRAGAHRASAGERAGTDAQGAGEGARPAGDEPGFLGRLRRQWAEAAP